MLGVTRHAYNWGLDVCLAALENNQKVPSAIDLHKKLVAEVKPEKKWYYEVSKWAPQEALRNLERAFKNWRKHKHCKKTVYKKKGKRDSFYLEGAIRISGNKIRVPIFGWLTCDELLPSVTPKNVTISKRASRWYISFRYELEHKPTPKQADKVGVDVGINPLVTCSDGKVFPNPKPYRKAKKKLSRLQSRLSKKQIKSNNRKKARARLARAYKRVTDMRMDNLHKITSYLAKNHGEVIIEDLNVLGMLKNHRLANAIADCGFFEFRRQLEYKCAWYGSKLTVVERFYPSSQICSSCGHRQKMPLKERVYNCSHCGISIDRDLNGSLNLLNYKNTPSSEETEARGEVTPLESVALETWMKQAVSSKSKQLSLFDLAV